MIESIVALTPLHYTYLAGVIVVLAIMVMGRDTPTVCITLLLIFGLIGLKPVTGGTMTVSNAILYAGRELMEVLATIALVISLSRYLRNLDNDYLMVVPVPGIMKTPFVTWWVLGLTILAFSLFLWPSLSVASVGTIMLPFAVRAGLSPPATAMAMSPFGYGFASSYDSVIQDVPAVSAGVIGVTATDILHQAWPVFWVMGIVTVGNAYLLNREEMGGRGLRLSIQARNTDPSQSRRTAAIMAAVTSLAFMGDILLMLVFQLKGSSATSMVSGAALILMCLGVLLGFGERSLEKVTEYVTDGFPSTIRIFAPVIITGAHSSLGGEGIAAITGQGFSHGIMSDWAMWLTQDAPLNKYAATLTQMAVGSFTGLDGFGSSDLPLAGSLACTLSFVVGASIPVTVAPGQTTAIFIGGGTIVPWGLTPVAAICNVSPLGLTRKSLVPVCLGFLRALIAACFLL